ncbi:leucine-rich repeat-containing protein 20 isoform X1 [Onthophagus taurus]|uniref:leucine-rich repeat-containing protein 20 isoform X1 n=1 Tax=Onthophagus taurus TaxID=166361 RepID=UPI000C1FFB9E|nr:leucine-rich repeat protein soc-2 isoform X1 [Onthophagus taurus]
MRPPSQFGDDIGNHPDPAEADPRMGAMMIYTRLAGRAIIRVVGRCNEAQENNKLDLSECELMQVPDAVYHLMRHTELKSCDLSGNVITKIPPKFAVKFSLISALNLSHNQMSKLPDEIADLGSLQRLDISHNTFISLPSAIFKAPKLELLNASDNHIADVDVEEIKEAPSLIALDLRNNPLTVRCHDQIAQITEIQVDLTPRQREDWEDLNI